MVIELEILLAKNKISAFFTGSEDDDLFNGFTVAAKTLDF